MKLLQYIKRNSSEKKKKIQLSLNPLHSKILILGKYWNKHAFLID